MVQDRIEDILKIRDLGYHKETQIGYATINRYIDFTLDDFNVALEVKLCNSKEDRSKIQEAINADITVYRTLQLFAFCRLRFERLYN